MMYSILKEIDSGNIPNQSDYKLELFQWAEIMEIINDFGYAKGITIYSFDDDPWYDEAVHSVVLTSPMITKDGIGFLDKNDEWESTYKGLNGVNDWLDL